METTSLGNKNSAKQQLHNIADGARDSADQLGSGLTQKASQIASDTSAAASEYAGKAGKWVQQNYGKTLGAVGALAAIGVAGYLLMGKKDSKSQSQLSPVRS